MSPTIDIDDIEEAEEFVEVWEQVMKAERTISRRFLHVGINHDLCISTKVTNASLAYFQCGFHIFKRSSKLCTVPMASTLVYGSYSIEAKSQVFIYPTFPEVVAFFDRKLLQLRQDHG